MVFKSRAVSLFCVFLGCSTSWAMKCGGSGRTRLTDEEIKQIHAVFYIAQRESAFSRVMRTDRAAPDASSSGVGANTAPDFSRDYCSVNSSPDTAAVTSSVKPEEVSLVPKICPVLVNPEEPPVVGQCADVVHELPAPQPVATAEPRLVPPLAAVVPVAPHEVLGASHNGASQYGTMVLPEPDGRVRRLGRACNRCWRKMGCLNLYDRCVNFCGGCASDCSKCCADACSDAPHYGYYDSCCVNRCHDCLGDCHDLCASGEWCANAIGHFPFGWALCCCMCMDSDGHALPINFFLDHCGCPRENSRYGDLCEDQICEYLACGGAGIGVFATLAMAGVIG